MIKRQNKLQFFDWENVRLFYLLINGLPVVVPVDAKYVEYIATCRTTMYMLTVNFTLVQSAVQPLMPYRMCKCNSLC